MFKVIEESPRGSATWDYDLLSEAMQAFDVLTGSLKDNHILTLIDDSGKVLKRAPPIPEKMTLEGTVRFGGSRGNIKVTIPSYVRDTMLLQPMDEVVVTIARKK